MKIAITGHRPNRLNDDYELISPLVLAIKKRMLKVFTTHKPEFVITGMALGIDTLAAKICVENNIRFIAAIPFEGQEKRWSPVSQRLYHQLLSKAYKVKNVSGNDFYEYECMQIRNEWMVDQLTEKEDKVLAVWQGTPGGTANCIGYAIEQEKSIIYINPKKL